MYIEQLLWFFLVLSLYGESQFKFKLANLFFDRLLGKMLCKPKQICIIQDLIASEVHVHAPLVALGLLILK